MKELKMKKLLFLNFLLLALLAGFQIFGDGNTTPVDFISSKSFASNGTIAAAKKYKANIDKKLSKSAKKTNYGDVYNDIYGLINTYYVEDIDDEKFFDSTLNGMLSSLDPHSAYLSKEDYDSLINDTKGEFSGLGIEVTMENSFVKVVTPIDNGPAYKAGVKSGDYISNINDESVIGMSLQDAVSRMRGKDAKDRGTVKLTILRSGENEPLEFKIKRDIIKTDSVKGRAEGDIIYLRISSFTDQTYENLIKEFNRVENEIGKKNVKGLVLDLRNNPGGMLHTSVFVAEAFLDKGKMIVSTKGKNGVIIAEYKSENEQDLIPNLPMAVLINEGSASASEIVAGALQDNKRAIIVGTQSFGKGSVQNVIGLGNGAGIKLTTARYYTPNGTSIQAKGITPDIEVKLAKIEEIDLSKWMTKEESLNGHLENTDDVVEKEKKKQLKARSESMYNKDYQLARAIDLLLGINFYGEYNKSSSK